MPVSACLIDLRRRSSSGVTADEGAGLAGGCCA
jgi:hypothetical protein